MSNRWPGSLIRKNVVAPTGPAQTGSAPGIWTMAEAAYWTKQGVWPTAGIIPDPNWSSVSYLMSTTANNNGQNNTFIDSSTNNFTITRFGNATQGSFSPFKTPPVGAPGYSTSAYAGSAYFDGSGDGLTVPNNAALLLGSGDFTLECWVRNDEVINNCGYAGVWGGSYILYREGTTYRFYYSGPTGSPLTSSIAAVANTWTHLAVVRNGTTLTLYVNGVSGASANISTTAFSTSANPFGIGANFETGSPGFPFKGYMAGLRLVKGTAVYTSAFTPPTAPLTAITNTSLLCNFTNANIYDASMNNFIETQGDAKTSTTQAKFGTTSVVFDGTGDVLLSPAGALFNFGTGDFTAEFWMYKTSSTLYQRILAYGPFGGTGNFQVEFTDDVTATVHINGGYLTTTVPSVLNKWVFVAVTRQSGSVRVFTDGVLRSTNTQAGSVSQTNPFSVGAVYDASSPFSGYLDEVRITKGVARYTATFTAPTAPFPVY